MSSVASPISEFSQCHRLVVCPYSVLLLIYGAKRTMPPQMLKNIICHHLIVSPIDGGADCETTWATT